MGSNKEGSQRTLFSDPETLPTPHAFTLMDMTAFLNCQPSEVVIGVGEFHAIFRMGRRDFAVKVDHWYGSESRGKSKKRIKSIPHEQFMAARDLATRLLRKKRDARRQERQRSQDMQLELFPERGR